MSVGDLWRIEVLLLPDTTLILTAATLDPLRAANRILGRRAFDWVITTPDGQPAMTASGIAVPAERVYSAEAEPIPLFVLSSYRLAQHMTKDLVRRVGAARRHRPLIAGCEAGALLVAESGLLNGRAATTHWEDLEAFTVRYPEILTRPDRFVIDGNRATSAGAAPTIDLMLEFVRRREGPGLALDVAKLFAYERGPGASAPRRVDGLPVPADPVVAAAVREMEAHLVDPLALPEVARRAGVGERHLRTLFAASLGLSPQRYYLRLRLALARRRIIESEEDVAEIAASAGFGHPAVFSRAYAARYGESPTGTRRRVRGR